VLLDAEPVSAESEAVGSLIGAIELLARHHEDEAVIWAAHHDALEAHLDPLDYRCDRPRAESIRLDESAHAIRQARASLLARLVPLEAWLTAWSPGEVPDRRTGFVEPAPFLHAGVDFEWPERLRIVRETLGWTTRVTISCVCSALGPAYLLAHLTESAPDATEALRVCLASARDDLRVFPTLITACR
jgi:hypothetical protein